MNVTLTYTGTTPHGLATTFNMLAVSPATKSPPRLRSNEMTTQNARFWDYVNDSWVKITLKPGQQLTHVTGGPNEEGYSYETTIYEHEWDSVVETCLSEARDCDGRFDHSSKHVCPLEELNSKPWDPSPSGYCPNWRSAHRSQRDYSAEAAGY